MTQLHLLEQQAADLLRQEIRRTSDRLRRLAEAVEVAADAITAPRRAAHDDYTYRTGLVQRAVLQDIGNLNLAGMGRLARDADAARAGLGWGSDMADANEALAAEVTALRAKLATARQRLVEADAAADLRFLP